MRGLKAVQVMRRYWTKYALKQPSPLRLQRFGGLLDLHLQPLRPSTGLYDSSLCHSSDCM